MKVFRMSDSLMQPKKKPDWRATNSEIKTHSSRRIATTRKWHYRERKKWTLWTDDVDQGLGEHKKKWCGRKWEQKPYTWIIWYDLLAVNLYAVNYSEKQPKIKRYRMYISSVDMTICSVYFCLAWKQKWEWKVKYSRTHQLSILFKSQGIAPTEMHRKTFVFRVVLWMGFFSFVRLAYEAKNFNDGNIVHTDHLCFSFVDYVTWKRNSNNKTIEIS